MNKFVDVPKIASRNSKLAETLKEYDFGRLEEQIEEIKTEDDLGDAITLLGKLDLISTKITLLEESNGKNIQASSIRDIINNTRNAFATNWARTIVITKLQ